MRFGDPVDIDHFRTFQGTLGDRNFTYSGGDVNGGAKKIGYLARQCIGMTTIRSMCPCHAHHGSSYRVATM